MTSENEVPVATILENLRKMAYLLSTWGLSVTMIIPCLINIRESAKNKAMDELIGKLDEVTLINTWPCQFINWNRVANKMGNPVCQLSDDGFHVSPNLASRIGTAMMNFFNTNNDEAPIPDFDVKSPRVTSKRKADIDSSIDIEDSYSTNSGEPNSKERIVVRKIVCSREDQKYFGGNFLAETSRNHLCQISVVAGKSINISGKKTNVDICHGFLEN